MPRNILENNMRRVEFNLQGTTENTTPLRRSFVNIPRRSLANEFDTEAPRLQVISNVTGGTVRESGHVPSSNLPNSFGADRFIPRRNGVNVDASRFYHLQPKNNESDDDLMDVFKEVKNATQHWRRQFMSKAFLSLKVFKGMDSKRVLHLNEHADEGEKEKKELKIGCLNNCQWKCRPRKCPLMNIRGDISKRYRDHGAQIFRFAMSIKFKNVIDWSSANTLVAGMKDILCVCDIDFKHISSTYTIKYPISVCSVKWNNKANKLAMGDIDGMEILYDTETKKMIWIHPCQCKNYGFWVCKICNLLWAKEDKHIISSCTGGMVVVRDSSDGSIIHHIAGPTEKTIALSPTEQYLATCAPFDVYVKFYKYPSLKQIFQIKQEVPAKAIAWHPWYSGLICIGGGPGDGSLSVWNINSQSQLGYRKVKFTSSVDALMFNKLSGELVVHWYYLEEDKLHSKIVVLAGLYNVVDVVPIHSEHKMLNIVWSPDHTTIAMQHRDSLIMWNFFGNESKKWMKTKSRTMTKDSGNLLRNYFTDTVGYRSLFSQSSKIGRNFNYYNIR